MWGPSLSLPPLSFSSLPPLFPPPSPTLLFLILNIEPMRATVVCGWTLLPSFTNTEDRVDLGHLSPACPPQLLKESQLKALLLS